MSIYDVNWKCTYKKMPDKVKTFMKEVLGKEEYQKLMTAIHGHHWIMLIGPECSGKTILREVLRKIGYPLVIDDNGLGIVVKTSKVITNGKTLPDVFSELEI